MGMDSNNRLPEEKSLVFYIDSVNKRVIHTLIDSGASDHCFVDKFLFILYFLLNQSVSGISTSIESTFTIVGRGTVKFNTRVDKKLRTIILNNTVYTPSLWSNLILVSKLLESGADTFFSVADNTVSVKIPNSLTLFSTTKKGGLFYIDIKWNQCTAYLSQSPRKAADFVTWHWCLAYAGTDTIYSMIKEKLVDELNTYGEMTLGVMRAPKKK